MKPPTVWKGWPLPVVYGLVAQVRRMAEQVDDDSAQTKVDNVATYFNDRADAVHYNKFKDQGWPQSSGAVEGGHIHFIHPLSKRGSGWLVPHLNNTLALACIRQSGWWDDFWKSIEKPPGTTSDAPIIQ